MGKKISEIVLLMVTIVMLLSSYVIVENEEARNSTESLVQNSSAQFQECGITAAKVGKTRSLLHDEFVTVRDMLDSYGFPGIAYAEGSAKFYVDAVATAYQKWYQKIWP